MKLSGETNEFTQMLVDELYENWEELRLRWWEKRNPDTNKMQRCSRIISPIELETWTWNEYGFEDVGSYYANGFGFIDDFQTIALRKAMASVDWVQVIELLEDEHYYL